MKTLKTIFASTILLLAIGMPVYAGDVHTPANPVPPPATCSTCEQTEPTDIQVASSDTVVSTDAETYQTSEFAVDMFLALLSFF